MVQQEQKKKQWRRKHEDFIESIRAAREYDVAAKTGTEVKMHTLLRQHKIMVSE